jgi:hypothetical protein
MDKIILICATGRSGSTTMQRLLNTIPNSNFCGENFGALNSLLEFYKKLKYSTINNIPGHFKPASYKQIVEKNIKPSWYNSYNLERTVQMIKIMITSLFKNNETTNVWGFKEIRYDNGKINLIKEFKELFPQTKVLIQIRDIKSQANSGWFKNDKNAYNYLRKYNLELHKFYMENRDFCYFMTFEKMFDKQYLRNLFQYIDCIEYFNEQEIDKILNNNIKD